MIRTILLWFFGWLISGLILLPCLLLNLLNGFKIDYHYNFQLWWHKKFVGGEEEH